MNDVAGLRVRARRFVLASCLALVACGGPTPLLPAPTSGSGGGGGSPAQGTGAGGSSPTQGTGSGGQTSGAAGSQTSGAAGATGGSTGPGTGTAGQGQMGSGTVLSSDPTACGAALPPEIRTRFIAFDSDRVEFRKQLYEVRADGSQLTRLLTDKFTDKEPSFSPDGKKIAFTSDRAGGTQIFVLDLAANRVTQLTSHPESADQPSFSRDGSLVTFHSGASVYVVGVDGTNERLVATGLGDFNAYFWPHFSADDTQLVFDRNNEIDAATIGSPMMRMIVQNTTTTIKQPAVSPDGGDVAYYARCFFPGDQHLSIWTTSFSTNTMVCAGRRVTPPDETFDSVRPAWGTTTYLAYERVDPATNVGAIAVISRELGSQPCLIVAGAGDNRNPSWSP
jgi:hypothetical protein